MSSDSSETPSTPAASPPSNTGAPDAPRKSKIKIGSQRDTFPAAGPPLSPPKPIYKPTAVAPPKPAAEIPAAPAATQPALAAVPARPVEPARPAATSTAPAPATTPAPLVPPPAVITSPVAILPAAPAIEPLAASDAPLTAELPRVRPAPASGPVPVPRARYGDSEDLQREIDEALGGLSIDTIVSREDVKRVGPEFETESRHRAMVARVHRENVFFSLGSRNEGIAALKQFKSPPEPGSMMEVVVTGFNHDEGLYELSVPGAAIDVSDWSDIAEGTIVEARVTGANTGGLECAVNALRGFIPASQVSLYRVENLGEFIGQKLACVVTETNPQRRNLVLSHRAVLEREKEATRANFLATLEVGATREGVVRSIRDFGAFVDLGGVDGLIHISKLSWDHVKHPSEVLQEGQKVSVKIDKIDAETGKIGLSYRDLMDHPWTNAQSKYPVGSIVNGVVSRLANFGAFVKLGPGVEGLIHISELSHQHVRNVAQILQEGQSVEVKILSLDADAQRIALSLKATLPPPETAKPSAAPEVEEPPRDPVIPKRKGPLKGGLGKSTGGEQFGLRW